MVEPRALLGQPLVQGTVVLVIGVIIGQLVGRLSRRLLHAAGIPEIVEGTAFERSAKSLGTSTVDLVARLSAWFIYGVAILTAINVARLLNTQVFWLRVTAFVPRLFVAAFVLVVGFVVADKGELIAGEKLKGVKLPEVGLLPKVVKYSVLYLAFLVALSQIGIATLALVVLLAAYLFGLIFLGGIAFKDFLRAGAAGIYVLLREPYSIGDEVQIGDRTGIVQGMDVFVTRIEDDDREYVVPNDEVFAQGVVKVRG